MEREYEEKSKSNDWIPGEGVLVIAIDIIAGRLPIVPNNRL